MSVKLNSMPNDRLGSWIMNSSKTYELSRRKAGDSAEVAAEKARTSFETSFPEGSPALGHRVYDIVATETESAAEVVGFLWIAPLTEGSDAWWVFDIAVDEHHRGAGYGRAAMQLAEKAASENGAATLGLNVFGYNTVARGLYDSLGYETTAVQMRKTV
ncbi:GNAT family N-acetyltransferase [Cryobacterium gelidum]|uniref:GNAT family N-acetyltransferase n=1 Tax=Cryobacterium gelidum TaxID=1259164 RepID=A0A4R9AQB2_9MICO|nr:GNAT family N-acetyltransferase [Cryobacterium gelidum]TFD67358.1 GNAT family N-acetyltransferase [Cryobacterium gelidum]